MVTQETEYSHTPTVWLGFFFFFLAATNGDLRFFWNNGGGAICTQLTIETEHFQHVNAIGFIYLFHLLISGGNLEQWWRSNVESQTETNGETKGLNTKCRERES